MVKRHNISLKCVFKIKFSIHIFFRNGNLDAMFSFLFFKRWKKIQTFIPKSISINFGISCQEGMSHSFLRDQYSDKQKVCEWTPQFLITSILIFPQFINNMFVLSYFWNIFLNLAKEKVIPENKWNIFIHYIVIFKIKICCWFGLNDRNTWSVYYEKLTMSIFLNPILDEVLLCVQ